ncbi:hypothetical protein DQ04_00301020 [Trypanosoma grayi]|uniref:hypothetical protein n=1 Tax=Trypanosoma grayi TaxID=71804 RepID=UPI0004F44AD6|nr:hypothetical protein DQ04_00301020 [Trypanosoma grayi]KEG14792.1 hypothetical protein DQ04_00301020 [Trypanosoma grayi]
MRVMRQTAMNVVVETIDDPPAAGGPPQGGEDHHHQQQQQQQQLPVRDVDTSVPSSEYEQLIVRRIEWLVESSKVNLRESAKVGRIAFGAVFFHQGAPVAMTFAMLLVSCVLYPTVQTITCTALFSVLYALCMAVQVYLLWARITEKKMRTAAVMGKVLARWMQRVAAMTRMPRQSQRERRAVFCESSAVLPAKAFRMVAVVDEVTGRLKHILKSLLVKGAKRLDEATLKARRYVEPVALCKLIDVMRMTLEADAIVLRPLRDKARPPRHPNLHIASNSTKEEEEEADTTDDSDHDHDPRSDVNGANTNSVSQKMEFLTHRIFLLMWVLGLLLSIMAGCIFYARVDAPIGEGVFLYPAVALLGMLPVNAILLNRVLVLYANVYLDRLFHQLVAKPTHSLDDRIPRFSFLSTMQALQRVLWRHPGRPPLCFSSSMVETLGMATVVALLDTTGIVTDMALLPTHMLMLKRSEHPEDSSSSDDENNAGSGAVSVVQDDDDATREQRREIKTQVRRNKFQKSRFLELRLTPSTRDDLAVQFADAKEFEERQTNVHPVVLCLLLHALVPEPENIETWTEPLRFCDKTLRWARATYWIPRACGFDDSIAATFRVIARIFQFDTQTRTGYRNEYPEQACTLLVEGEEDHVLHAFTVGTVYMVTHSCPLHFTGSSIEALDVEVRAELVHVGKRVWGEGMDLETVAVSHRMLPEQYRSCAEQLRQKGRGAGYREFFFHNGVQVTANVTAANTNSGPPPQQKHEQEHQQDFSPTEGGPKVEPSGSDGKASVLPDQATLNSSPNDGDGAASLNDLLQFLVGSSHVFLGLVGLRDSVRPNVQSSMSVLEKAGIRCMYFCADNERCTKSFGSRLGLETDWNCCISLKEGAVKLDRHSIRAQLPVGIQSIRKHILHVDPIPLQVNMFSHAHSASTRAMLSILQDNHEVVVSIGSVFNHGNVRSFIQSDLSIGVLPTRRGSVVEKEEARLRRLGRVVEPSNFGAAHSLNRDLPLYRNVAEMIACSCTLSASPTASILPIVTTLIRQARLRLSGISNCVEFTLHANFFVTLVNVVAVMAGAPLLISPTAAIFELNVIIPILALSCTYTAYADMDPMNTISSRHNYFVRLAIFRHSALVWCLRYIPSIVALLLLGITCGERMCNKSVIDLALSASDACMTSTRGYIALTLNYWLMIHSWTHMSRHHPLSPDLSFKTRYGKRSMYLFKSFRWVSASGLATVLSVLFVIVDTSRVGVIGQAFFPSKVHFFVALLFPVVLLLLDVPIKTWRARRFSMMQKFRRLSFGTRLGMHSPRGDYEPEGVMYTNMENDAEKDEDRPPTLRQRLHDIFYRFTTMQRGKLELNCVCCDHIGGNYATYHVNANNV